MVQVQCKAILPLRTQGSNYRRLGNDESIVRTSTDLTLSGTRMHQVPLLFNAPSATDFRRGVGNLPTVGLAADGAREVRSRGLVEQPPHEAVLVEDVTTLVVRRPNDAIAHLVLMQTNCTRIRQEPPGGAIVFAHRQRRKSQLAARVAVFFFLCFTVHPVAVGKGEYPSITLLEQRHGVPESLLVPLFL
jgi:hypothetical protein